MTDFDATGRSPLADDECFRRKDAELLLRARETERRQITVIQGDLARPL